MCAAAENQSPAGVRVRGEEGAMEESAHVEASQPTDGEEGAVHVEELLRKMKASIVDLMCSLGGVESPEQTAQMNVERVKKEGGMSEKTKARGGGAV